MTTETQLSKEIRVRAMAIAKAGSLEKAITSGDLNPRLTITLSEAIVLGLLKQGVRKYLAIFGHGSTDLGEVLRVYDEEGVTRTWNFRNEVEMAHVATGLSWQYGEIPAVVTSIGPGALQAMAGSLAAACNGIGVYHIYGDETTGGEGYNMQQIPKEQQGLFGQITQAMGQSYTLHTPSALRECLKRGSLCVNHPYKAGPFYVMLPLNTQPQMFDVNLATLPSRPSLAKVAPVDTAIYGEALDLIRHNECIVIKAGGGCRGHDAAIRKLAEAIGAAVVQSPGSTGVLPDEHPQNMHVGGSKGSISGNFAMENAELVISIGTRAVCQADCSGIGYPNAKAVININGDLHDLLHYANTTGLQGDITEIINQLIAIGEADDGFANEDKTAWLAQCEQAKLRWVAFKQERYAKETLHDEVWNRDVLTQPAAIKTAADFANRIGAMKFFDAGDIQANGFQIVEDQNTGDTITETGASYMGFSVSALLASGLANTPRYGVAFTGDGSFMMNPQVLIDGVEHGVNGTIVIFDNRCMAAITGLQKAQYQNEFRTKDQVAVDYVAMAKSVGGINAIFGGHNRDELNSALKQAHEYDGLSVIHVPVYSGDDELGSMGAYGSWNVGNWVADVQARYLEQKI